MASSGTRVLSSFLYLMQNVRKKTYSGAPYDMMLCYHRFYWYNGRSLATQLVNLGINVHTR